MKSTEATPRPWEIKITAESAMRYVTTPQAPHAKMTPLDQWELQQRLDANHASRKRAKGK